MVAEGELRLARVTETEHRFPCNGIRHDGKLSCVLCVHFLVFTVSVHVNRLLKAHHVKSRKINFDPGCFHSILVERLSANTLHLMRRGWNLA